MRAHRKHRWQQWSVQLWTERGVIAGVVVTWGCSYTECHETVNQNYRFRKPRSDARTYIDPPPVPRISIDDAGIPIVSYSRK